MKTLKNLKLKISGQPHDELLITTEPQLKHYKAKEDRIFLKDELFFRKYYGETGSVKYYYILIPKHLLDEVPQSLHGEFGKHARFTKIIVVYSGKCSCPNMAQLITKWVMSCEQGIREPWIDRRLTHPPLQNRSQRITAPEDAKQIDLVLELPHSGGYDFRVTGVDVFSK